MKLLLVLFVCGFAATYDPSKYCRADPSFVNNQQPGLTLLKIQLMTRHGDRTPVYLLPTALENVVWNCTLDLLNGQQDPTLVATPQRLFRKNYLQGREKLRGNCQFGQLTSTGALQHQMLGNSFRQMYVKQLGLLPPTLNTSLMYVRSTDLQRTILSAYNFLQGLYPMSSSSVETITVNTMDSDTDDASGPNTVLCPRLAHLLAQQYNSTGYTTYFNKYLTPLAMKLAPLWNMSVSSLDGLFFSRLNDVVRSRYCHQMTMPPHMSLQDAEQVMQAMSYLYNYAQNSFAVLQYSEYTFLSEWLSVFNDANAPPFTYYSAHDSSVRNFLLALHAFDFRWPPLASHVVLELWQNQTSGQRYVAMQYDGQIRQMLPPCNSTFCPWEQFVQLVNSYKVDMNTCF